MKIDHPADFIMIVALATVMAVLWASCSRAEEPTMQDTINSPTITQWIMSQNPPCGETEKVYEEQYAKLLTNYMGTGECKRYRPWKCRTSGYWGVDIEDLPKEFCQ